MAKKAGVGAQGSAYARFFHPSERIRQQYPNTHARHRCENVIILGKEQHKVRRKMQVCYKCRIPDIDDGTEFFIVCSNFKVEVEGAHHFVDEAAVAGPPAAVDEHLIERVSATNHGSNITGDAEDIANLRAQGIEVDNEDVLPENDVQPPAAAPNEAPTPVGQWKKPTICPRKACSFRTYASQTVAAPPL